MAPRKRTNNLYCEDYFMAVAKLAAEKRCDDTPHIGACVINKDNKVIGVGHNRKLSGTANVHAEVNAILNTNSKDLNGCTLYVTSYPCNNCAKVIIQSGIRSVYHNGSTVNEDAREMFDYAKITERKYIPRSNIIQIDIESINDIHSPPVSPSIPWESTDEIEEEKSHENDKIAATDSPSAISGQRKLIDF